ncbi:hypothetical protein pipiens_005571 [Culex pipiens pipiens]|uniref:Uncharacterized protein n=1 Tax=Culex pipiens pipiens TaxID=38569 RepID=A0ABD1DZQ4_CULPP
MAYIPALVAGTAVANLLGGAGKNEDVGRLDSKVDANQREQSQYNYKMAETVSGQGQQLKTLESSTNRISSRTDKLSDLLGEASLQLGRVQSDTSGLRRDQDRFGTRLDQFQSDQSSFNTEIARREAGLEVGLRMFSEQQRSLNDEFKLETAGMQKRLGEHSTGLEVMKSRADGLQHDQDRISLDVARAHGRVDKFQTDQNSWNLDYAERSARMEVQQRMTNEQQGLFNTELHSRTVAMQDKLGNTVTRVELAHGRADHLQHGQDELSLSLRQTNQRVDQFNSDQNQRYQLLSASTVRNEERQLGFMSSQTSLNEKLLNRTDALTDKYFATEGKLDLVNHRADTLQEGQAKIDDELKRERQIQEARLRDQFKHNETLSNNYTRVEERQNCFISDQKSRNEQITNQTENIRDKLGKTSHNVDFVNFRVETLQAAQQKLDNEQKDMDKRLHVVEHCSEGFRDEQKTMNETLKNLLAAVTEIGARMKTVESRLDALQAGYERVNAMCIKFEATGGSFGKGPDEDLVNSRADGLLNDFNKFSSTVGRVEDKVEKNRTDQCEFNMAISKQGSQLEERQNQFQATVNSRTNELQYVQQKLQGELANTSVKVGVIEYRTGDMQQEQKLIHDKQNDITMNVQQISTKLNFHEKSFDAVQQDQRNLCDKLVADSTQCEKLQASQEKLQDRLNTMQKESEQQLRLFCLGAALLIALITYLFKLVPSK